MTVPLVTVLTAVRNGARLLPETIASIRSQTVADWEYIIVDDASEDETVAVVEHAAQLDPRIRLIRREAQGGPYVAANDGLRAAVGRYVARIDADDVATPARLELQLRFLADRPELRACGGFHRLLSSTGDPTGSIVRVPVHGGVLLWRLCAGSNPVHSSAFIERAALEELGGYKPLALAQDWRLWCELSRRRWLGIVPEVVVYRRLHADALTEREGPLQTELALDVAREHIRHLSGEDWALDDVKLLRFASQGWQPAPLAAGLRIIDRWAELWRADPALALQERADLRRWTRFLKRRHARRWGEAIPIAGRFVWIVSAGETFARRAVKRMLLTWRRQDPA